MSKAKIAAALAGSLLGLKDVERNAGALGQSMDSATKAADAFKAVFQQETFHPLEGMGFELVTGNERRFELSEKAKRRRDAQKLAKKNYVHPMVRLHEAKQRAHSLKMVIANLVKGELKKFVGKPNDGAAIEAITKCLNDIFGVMPSPERTATCKSIVKALRK
jgi:hypothetical protein